MRAIRACQIARCCLGLTIGLTIESATGLAADSTSPAKTPAIATPVQELTVSARAVEQPLMKYRLLPAEYELHAGNAAPILLRIPWEQLPYFTKVVPTFNDYLELPLDSLKLRNAGDIFAPGFYRTLKRAAYRQTADWQYPIGEEPVSRIHLSDAQGSRDIVGRGLSVRIRSQISRGELADAREGILVGLAVSRHYARSPFVVTQLISIAIDTVMLTRIEELISQPDSPNLYWALTALPRPFVDLRPSIELEQRFLQMTVPGLENLDQLRTEDQWAQRVDAVIALFLEPGATSQPEKKYSRKQILENMAKRGRAELPGWIDGGAARVKTMSDSEVGLRWYLHAHEEQSHETTAFMSLEPPTTLPRLKALQQRLAEFRTELGVPTLFILEHPLNFYLAAHKLHRRIDALRIVEAIRNYAATHDGGLPDSLEKIADTPIPMDAFTGKPFPYAVTDGTATLSAPGIRVEGTTPGIQVGGNEIGEIRYRIQLVK
jgi:hypothetical protein